MKKLFIIAFIILSAVALYADTLDRPDDIFVGSFDALTGSVDGGKTWSERYSKDIVAFRGRCVIWGGQVYDCYKMVGTRENGVRYNLFWISGGAVGFIICYNEKQNTYLIQVLEHNEEIFRVVCVR